MEKDNNVIFSLFFTLFVHRQINTAASSLKCTSPPCFPLLGSVPVRTMAQNSQSAGSAGDGPRRLKQLPCLAANVFTGFVPLCCTACLIHRSWAKPTAVVRRLLRERCKRWSAFSCALRYRRRGRGTVLTKKDSFWSKRRRAMWG